MKNKLIDLNNHLFSQLERLSDESMTAEQIEKEVTRSDAIVGVSEQIIRNADLSLNPTDVLSSNLVGLTIANSQDVNVGEIKDLVIANGTLSGYVVSVGGFLGIGEHYVVVSPSAIQINYLENDNKWVAVMDTTKDELTAAPQFKYDGRWAK